MANFAGLSPEELHAINGAFFCTYGEAEVHTPMSGRGIIMGELEFLRAAHSLHDPDIVGTPWEYASNLALAAQLRNLTEGEQ